MHRFVLALVVWASACTATPPPMSCTVVNMGATACIDFIAGYVSDTATAACSADNGTFSTGQSCPPGNRVGRCTTTTSAALGATYVISYYAPTTTAQAQAVCPPPMPQANTTYEFQAN